VISLPSLFPKAKKINAKLYVTICCFHEDEHASLRLQLFHGKWRYRCFSCEASGDAIDVLVRRDGLTFRKALDVLELKMPPPPSMDLWERKYWRLLVCDACRDERAEVRDMFHLLELCDTWEIAPDAIAAIGPQCLAKHEHRSAS
jgi:hypothetical protein